VLRYGAACDITGCAVSRHCYKGDVSFLWENGNLTPCEIETLKQVDTQFFRIDCVHELNVHSKFGKNPFTGDFWAKWWNITFCVTFLFIFFSLTNVEMRPVDGFWRAMAQKTRNRTRMCLFCGY